jgi:glycosyltransferase involved in cell wall biosynthesis
LATVGRTDEPARFLRALDAQTYRGFRLIVVDQNSDDRLAPILGRYEEAFPILHLSAQPQVSRARNLGLEKVAGDLVAFPDDDCWYPPGLLQRVATFFSSHPEWGGLTGRAVDETGKASAGRPDVNASEVDAFNLWRRVATATVFARRRLIDVVGAFDETLGPGAETPWQAGEDLDYVVRALRAGCSIYYDPTVQVYHPGRREHSRDPDVCQGYGYGAGVGRVLRKNNLPWWFASYCFGRSFGASALSLLAGRKAQARFYWAVGRGRVRGWLSEKSPAAWAESQSVPNRFPLGHYYSPLPDARELRREPRRSQLWPAVPRDTPGIDWQGEAQVSLCQNVFARQRRVEFVIGEASDPKVYFTSNDQYPALDAWILEGLLRWIRPKRMIEIGSGFSSLVTAYVNRKHLDGRLDFTCIEPYPRRFLIDGVPGISGLITAQVQDVSLNLYDDLGDGDVLFVDGSHTVKTGGDVPWIYNEILPRLRPGVFVHMHDIFLPRDYPEPWVSEGWGWNEQYLVHSFLLFNSAFDVVFSSRWMIDYHRDQLVAAFPDFPLHESRGGSALWIRRR